MALDLRPVHARLERAAEHRAALEHAVATYCEGPPYRINETLSSDELRVTLHAERAAEPPAQIAMILSDFAHQLRSALDNLAGCLRVGGPTNHTYFPITTNETGYRATAAKALDGVPTWARDEIEAVQPFPIADPHGMADWLHGEGRALLDLHDFARLDRHRAPRLQLGFVRPDWAAGSGDEELEFRVDPTGRWASAEYSAVRPAPQVQFAVEVLLIEPEVPRINTWEVTDVARWFDRAVRWLVVERFEQRAGHET